MKNTPNDYCHRQLRTYDHLQYDEIHQYPTEPLVHR